MNKEQAENYIKITEESIKLSVKKFGKFLPVNLCLLGVAGALHRELTFLIIIVVIAVLNIVLSIMCAKKRLIKMSIIRVGTQLLFFCIILDLIIFGLFKFTDIFVLWEFLTLLGIQTIAFGISFLFVKNHIKNFKEKEGVTKTEAVGGAVAGFCYALTMILCRILNPSLSVVVIILTTIINVLVCLINLIIIAIFYRVYLIKKYDLTNLENNLIGESNNDHQDIM